jgi:fatty acid desaturase
LNASPRERNVDSEATPDPGGMDAKPPGADISDIVPTTSPVRSVRVGSGYSELVREIRERGLLKPRPTYYLVLGTINAVSLALVVVGLVLLRDSWWAITLAPAFAVVSTQIAFFSHDIAHRQVSHGGRARALLCLVHGNLLNGLSFGWWEAKHNAHHAHPNDLEADPDVAVGAFVWDGGQASARSGTAGWLTRHQAGLFFPMLTLEAFNLRVSSVQSVLRPGLRYRKTEALLLLGHFVLYGVLLLLALTWAQALVFLAVHQALFGLYLGSSFAPSHKGMPALTAEEASDPLLRQVLASRNIRGGRALDLAMGGLNLQIEHHLFPSMPRPNLRHARPVILRHCQEREIRYSETTLLRSYGIALRHLHEVGAPLRAGPPEA